MLDQQDPTFAPSEEYRDAERTIPHVHQEELDGLVGAIVAEHVNRGWDTASALERVIAAARRGAAGSKKFDREEL